MEPKEYDFGLHTTHGVFTQGQRTFISTAKEEKPKKKYCPLMKRTCAERCALYDGGRCGVLTGGDIKENGVCPVSGSVNRHCTEDCEMYKDGQCMIFHRGRESEKNE